MKAYQFFVALVALQLFKSLFACPTGCTNCNEQNICQQCEQNFELDQELGVCIFTGCESYLYLQNKGNQQPAVCQAICDQGYQGDSKTNLCINLSQCSLTYSSQTGISQVSETIKLVLPYQDQYFIIVYSTYISKQLKSTGRFVQNIPFQQNLEYVEYFQDNFYIFQNDNKVVKWNIQNNSTELFKFALSGNIDQSTQIISLNYQFGIVITFDKKKSIIYATLLLDLTQQSFVQYSSTIKINQLNNQDYYFFNDLILITTSNQSNGINVSQFYIDQNNNLNTQNQSNQNYCKELNSISILKVLNLNDKQNMIILNTQPQYLILDQNSCKIFQIPQPCSKVKIASTSTSNMYFLQLQTIVLGLNTDLTQFARIQIQANIVDFLTISTSNLNMILAVLDDLSILNFFSLDLQNLQYQQLDQYKLNQFNPTSLMLINQIIDNNNQLEQMQIIAYSKQLQSITLNRNNQNSLSLTSQYFLKPFQRKLTDMQSSITSLDTNEVNNLVTFCSTNGQIMTWDYSIIIKPKLVDSTIINNQGLCISIQYLINNYALILFSNSIIAYDAVHSKILNTWTFNNAQSKMTNRYILPVNGISYLLYDSCFQAFDQNFQQIFQDCNPILDDVIIQAKLDPSMYLVVQKAYSFSVFKVLNNKLNLSGAYVSIAQIQIWKIRNFPQSYQDENNITFEIISYFSDQSLTIFSQDLQPIKSYQNILISTAIDINFVSDDPYDNLYVVGGVNSQKSASFKYQSFALFKNQTTIFSVTQQSGLNKLFSVYKYINQGNGAVAYTFKAVVDLSYLTVVQSFYYNMQNQDNFYSTNYLNQYVYMNVFQTIKKDQFYMFGDQYGLMTIDGTRRKVYSNVYNLSPQDIQSKDFILGVYQSLVLQKFFIIKSNIQVYKLLTNEFIEILEVKNDPSQPIKYFSILDQYNIVICIKQNILFVKDYKINKVYYYTNFSQITNYLVDSNNIYLYGSNVSILGLDLTEKYSQKNTLDNSLVQQCAFSSIGLICKKQSATIIIFDKNNLNPITTLQQRFLDNNYRFEIDNLYQRIILYSSNIEVYSFNGNFQMYISSINTQISTLQIFTNDISVTSTSIIIYDRKTLNYRGQIISPGGGTILNTGFIPELNQLVFYLAVIRFAQIFTISLDNLQTVMQYKNTFTQNQPSVIASYSYDKDQNLFIVLDLAGSFQTIDYQAQFVTWTTTKFVEYDQYSAYNIVGFSLDFQNNNLFVYSQTQVFNLCYGDLTNQVIRLRTSKKQLFAQISDTTLGSSDQTSIAFIIAGDQGLLYKYQNTAFEYFYQLNEEIQSINYISNLKLLIIALSQSFVIFNNFDQNSLANLNPWQNQQQIVALNSLFSLFICEDVFVTKDGLINHYDFLNQKYISTIKLQDPQSRIIKNICSSISQNVYLGLSNGDIIIYNRSTYQKYIISLVSKQQGQQYFGLEIAYLAETSTDLWACFSSTQGIFKINLKDQSFIQIIQFNSLNTYKTIQELNVMIFDVDEQNSRFFLNFIGEKVLRVFDLSGNLLQIISLAGIYYNTLQISSSHLLVYTTFHVMIYDRITLQYIQRIRRDNHNDIIVEVVEINSKYLVILSQSKYEIFQLKQNSKEAVLMDQVLLQNPTFMSYAINNNDNSNQNINSIMQIFLLSSNQVLEQKYNLIYESIQTKDKICSMDVSVSSFYDVSFSMSKIKPVSFPDPSQRSMIPVSDYSLNNYWNILLNGNDIRAINFQSTLNSLTQVYPVQTSLVSNNQDLYPLQIYSDTFTSYKKQEVQIRDFRFIFQKQLESINFYENSLNITFNNIQIESQVTDNITFQFFNMSKIVFDQIYLKNLQRQFNPNFQKQNYFFSFENVEYVNIYNLVLDNSNLQNLSFIGLISAINAKYLVIKNLTIKNSNIYPLIRIQQVENLSINNLSIINCTNASNNLNEYVLNITGVTNTTLSNINISHNYNLLFIYTSNIFQDDGIQYIQQTDILKIDSLYSVLNQISYSKSQSLISVQSSFCIFNNFTYQYNQGNVFITLSKSLLIENSVFQNNLCLNGGALSLIQCSSIIKIKNSKFQYNEAYASGGAIYLENIDAQIQMDSLVQINKNQALIGGGLRLLNTELNLLQSLNFNYKNIIFDNDAQLYGKNVGTFLQNATVGVIQDSSSKTSDNLQSDQLKINYNIIQNEDMKKSDQEKFQQILQIFKFQSGGMISFCVKMVDSEGTYLKFSIQKYNLQQYPNSIMSELKQIQFKIQSYVLSQDILINGHNIITSSDFDDLNNQFVFTQIQISSMPNQTTSLQIIPSYISANINVLPIYIEIHMRICYPGEVVKQLENNIYSCYSCPYGSYSITDPTKDEFWFEQISNTPFSMTNQSLQSNVYQSECQKCPDSAFVCQNNTLILKTGYWRKNNTSTDIIQCSTLFNACDDQNSSSKQGCLKGYMGPVCRACDVSGQIWDGQRFSQSFINQLKCELCNDINYQIFFILLAVAILLCYFILSMILFFNSFVHSCLCYYLRKIKMLPISRHAILDQSSFYLKILINYIQISSVLVSMQVSFLPDLLSSLPNYIGDPNSQVIVSINCVVSLSFIKQFGQAHVIQVFQAFLPLLFLIVLLGIVFILEKLKIFGIKKYHKFTLMNFIFIFFQPDQINFFSKQLTCTQFGSEKYVTSDLTIKCNDPDYNSFTYPLAIPLILIWSLFPFIIFKLLQKKSKVLQTCFTLYYFGYYYQEFKEKYYYWEFIRIYLRVIVVVAFTLTSQSYFISYQIVIFILFLYIMFTLYFNPIRSNNLQRFDLFCYQVIILNSLLSTINTEIKSYAISGIIYCLHLVFIFMIVLAIIFIKLNNPLTYVGKCFRKILSVILPRSIYSKYLKSQITNWKIYTLWKKIQKNLNLIVQLQAIEKVTQEKSQLKQNQLNQTFDTVMNLKSNVIQKISLINQVQRSYIQEHSKCKDQTEEIDFIQLAKNQSENSKNNEIQLINGNKSDYNDQFLNDDYSQQAEQVDEINFQSELYQSNVQNKTLDQNYETQFKVKKNLDFNRKSDNKNKI
ncbi:transmembrane protein, putative (macronuclear) [Tetrahymena thermophila SB210]|uniref:Transmembrane protein, putative n=1 Tax=Tetrahymena thermophila (strain SB210) TaxID=312017 RepID=I7M0V5_TETTS|nr:transmembrane protein, putative [Tetrahymena thermophila SB210]EAR91013.2 transmembrane protein, putative [Tetrahymena thermophila SB210]|eukprot:XP_001011258.2 transmembrane protein, putative [Tetrahymena thermophila SB210]